MSRKAKPAEKGKWQVDQLHDRGRRLCPQQASDRKADRREEGQCPNREHGQVGNHAACRQAHVAENGCED